MPEVQFRGVGKRFAGGAAPVLDGIDLSIAQGEFVSIIGPSGCGKSTLLKMAAGLSVCSAGEIVVNGLTPQDARESVSFVFQDATLLPWRTVEKNVGLALELEGRSREEIAQTTGRLLELVGLSRVAGHYPRQLSGGMKMRVSIARALATKPRILLMDEPFAALDEITRRRLADDVLALWTETRPAIVFVTHNVEEAVYMAARVVVMSPGPGRSAGETVVDAAVPRPAQFRSSVVFRAAAEHVSADLEHAMAQRGAA